MAKATYKDAGVDLDVYRQSMARLPDCCPHPLPPRPAPGRRFCRPVPARFHKPLFARKYEDPVLVACTDGVGTKLKVARCRHPQHRGHRPGGHERQRRPLLRGRAAVLPRLRGHAEGRPRCWSNSSQGWPTGCIDADCALLGGETAILPDLYAPGDYDLAGFCVGVVPRKQIIDGSAIAARRRGARPGLNRPAFQRLQPGA